MLNKWVKFSQKIFKENNLGVKGLNTEYSVLYIYKYCTCIIRVNSDSVHTYDYVTLCCRMRDYLHEYIEQLLDANADDEETPASRQSSLAARQALADYRMVDHVLRSPLLPADMELRLSHAVSLWNLAFEFAPNK